MVIAVSRKKLLLIAAVSAALLSAAAGYFSGRSVMTARSDAAMQEPIKWVDFNVSYEALRDTMEADISSYGEAVHYDWIELLSYLACVNGNDFSGYKEKALTELIEKLSSGITMDEITKEMKYYQYYKECFEAILGEYIGEFAVQTESDDAVVWEKKYGLKVFCPIAKNYSFNHYDDFANARTYGYSRLHTGHDLFGSIGTPVVAIESGVVESVGWNRYGGWRIGIRSFDKKRYYYYAHLRKDHPYTPVIKEGAVVKAGDVIGYLGMTGYSEKENVNNINRPHLHMGIQLIFDESQKDGSNEIWVDGYNILKLLQNNCSEVYSDEESGEYVRRYDFYEALLEGKDEC